jgi:hypothetical protein
MLYMPFRQRNFQFVKFQQIILLTQHISTDLDHMQAFIIIKGKIYNAFNMLNN